MANGCYLFRILSDLAVNILIQFIFYKFLLKTVLT